MYKVALIVCAHTPDVQSCLALSRKLCASGERATPPPPPPIYRPGLNIYI